MASFSLAFDRSSVVLIGQFNPSILHPAWFGRYGYLRDEEIGQAKNVIVTETITKFKADWLEIQVEPQRLIALTDDPSHAGPLRDLVLSTFTTLEHTHFWALGINRQFHYKLESEEVWHRFGHFLAPKRPWEKHLTRPGMRSLMIQGSTDTVPGAQIQYMVEPSINFHPGVFFALNAHYGRMKKSATNADGGPTELSRPETRRELLQLLTEHWESARTYAKSVAESLLGEDF